jgi:hypothetical protein
MRARMGARQGRAAISVTTEMERLTDLCPAQKKKATHCEPPLQS